MKQIITILFLLTIITHTAMAQNGKYATVNGLNMYYEIHGAGQPLVLIHGGGSTITTTFGAILPTLAATHKVIAVELQAHGHTGDRDAPESFEQDANDVAELLRQLDIPKADILGFSNGGQTAMVMGMKHAERVNKLIIASAFSKRAGTPEGFWDGFDHASLNNLPQVYKDAFLKIRNDDAALQNMFNKDKERMRTFKGWTDEAVRSIKAPALIIAGDRDVVTPEHAAELHRLIAHSRLAILPGTHGSYMGEIMSADKSSTIPALFVGMINEFLEGE